MPDSIYKFFPYNSHDLDALANNYLWFSHYSNFNDPFEDVFIKNSLSYVKDAFDEASAIKFYKHLHKGQLPPHVVEEAILDLKMRGEFEQSYHEMLLKTFKGVKNTFEKFVSESKACCFARDSQFGRVLKNRLMWSHYADGLRGFCVEFDRATLIQSISNGIGKDVFLSPMRYGELKAFDFKNLLAHTAEKINTENYEFGIGSIVSYKSKEWEYESEYRLITDAGNAIQIAPESIISITVGSKMADSKLNTLKSILRGNERIACTLYEAYIDTKSFNLERKKIGDISTQA
ncbi:DUF2971 domain-containing protein [Photobacterium leiognathi]|uniref:DUF2971 domain-containing protein n=1 Tax=Photobacterium leiognathi TaxID=553611 RepID=UPI003AF375EB